MAASTVSLTRGDGVATMLLGSPILARSVLTEMTDALDVLAQDSSPPALVLSSAHPTIFLAGAHLAEIGELDFENCTAYAEHGRSVASRFAAHPAPIVAAIGGSCSGGGFDLVMACDSVIASPNASFSHPGVRRGLVTGWGGTTSIASAVGPSVTRRALLEGTALDAPAMAAWGVVQIINANPNGAARATARRLARLHPSRLPLWRLLRGPNFVDRFRAFVVEKS